MTNRFFGALLCSGLLMLAVLTPATAPALPKTGACNPTSGQYSASALLKNATNSTTYVNIPEASVSFTQAGPESSCVIVRFSAEAQTPFTGLDVTTMFVRAMIAGSGGARPSEIYYSSNENAPGAHSFEFIFPDVAPGSHVVHMQFRSSDSSKYVYIHRHNTIVQFAQ